MESTALKQGEPRGRVLTFSPKTNEVCFLDYTEKTVHTEHGAMYEIKTDLGLSIKVTDDHSLATVGTENFFRPLPPAESLGAFVPTPFKVFNEEDWLMEPDMSNIDNLVTWRGIDLRQIYLFEDTITCKTEEDLHTEMFLLYKAGLYFTVDPETKTITIDSKCSGFVPEDGVLVPREEASRDNLFRRLPFTWSTITEVIPCEREEITYDFTIPEFPLFMGNWILVYDTMSVHVPVTEAAKQHSLEKMLPSKNLFSVRTLDPMMVPQQENIFGLFLASTPSKEKSITVSNVDKLKEDIKAKRVKPDNPVVFKGNKTTAGIVVLNDLLPEKYRDYKLNWTKAKLRKILGEIGREEPSKYSAIADEIKELGASYAYDLGTSFKSSDFDLKDLKKERDVYFDKVEVALGVIDKNKGLSNSEKHTEKSKVLRDAQQFAMKLTDKQTGNSFQQWAWSGARGSKSQVQQILASPTVVADSKDRIVPLLIRKSYNEGLSTPEFWTSSYGTRKGTISAKLSVAPAGMMNKELAANTLDIVISERDCGTKEGIKFNIGSDKDIIGRTALLTGKTIDSRAYEELVRRKVKDVEVRSPLTCRAKHGICQLCYGYDEKGSLPAIGNNMGIQAAQALSEPLTQLGLSAKHTAGTASDEQVGLNTVNAFFQMTNQYAGAAVISSNAGKVDRIEKNPIGGSNLFVGTKKYHIAPNKILNVKAGDTVASGDVLTSGVPNLQKIVPHKGIDESRKLFTHYAKDLYSRAGTPSVSKNFETVARGLINFVEIQDPGGFEFIIGDIVDYNELQALIREKPFAQKPKYIPYQRGTSTMPQSKRDPLVNLGFKHLKKNIIENAARGATSIFESYNPIPSYMRGVNFGQGKDGRY